MIAPSTCCTTPASMGSEAGPATGEPGAVTEDRILGGQLVLRQPATGYRVGIDPVFLAAAAPLRAAGLALDLGCGVGAAALCLARRQPGLRIAGLELQPVLAELGAGNAALNGLGDRVRIHQGDLLRPPGEIAIGAFDLVLANPPFHALGRASVPVDASRAQGHMEGEADLAAWIERGLAFAAAGGVLVMIHKPDRLGDIVDGLEGRAGAIAVYPLWPGGGRPARRIIVRATKGSAAPLTLHPGMVLHDADGRYSIAAEAVLRQAAGLEFL
jgi:tRNA1(Val) A37 N6-methylase TrmN6